MPVKKTSKKKRPGKWNEFEKALHRQLVRAKTDVKYEPEKIPYVLAGHYTPDFVITTASGKLYIEAKGYFRPEHKRKMAAVKKQHPDKDIRIVFMKKNKSNIKWAEKHGFRYAIGFIPEDWINGL